ncbi:MAG: hypothetical protein ACRDL7_14940, partial [Gaiellaceae bacterium]
MIRQFTAPVIYFLEEGRSNLTECLRSAFRAAKNHGIEKIIIFTAQGAGVVQALDEFCAQPAFAKVKLIAVTFPVGQPFKDSEGKPMECEISPEVKSRFRQSDVPLLRAH